MKTQQISLALNAGNPSAVRAYFEKVRSLLNSGNQFPIDFDEVWPLCYERKDNAVRALKTDYIEGFDYQALRKNEELKIGITRKNNYSLSVPCLEYFIVRKVRPVFEIYRQVFHRVADFTEKANVTTQTGLVQLINDLTARVIGLEGKIDRMHKAKTEYFKAEVCEKKKKANEALVDARKKRDAIVEIIGKTINQDYYSDSWAFRWGQIWEALRLSYGIRISDYPRHTGEHYLDVAVRYGFIDQIYEYVKAMYKA